ncbi:MAG: O-antigen ligase family protein, partial [Solirubrobacterales bacterium]|nr:O-antigen ligase family protein [Solirubrobacterales bacterium]
MSRTAPFAAPVSLLALGGEAQSGAPGRSSRAEAVGLLAVGAALGISQVVHGAYDESVWAPIALGALALMLGLMLGAPRRVPLAVLVPLLGLWSWSLVSSAWSESTDSAHLASNRWLLYAAAFGLLAWSIAGNRRRALTLLAGTAAGILGVALWMLVRMLSGHGPELFLTTRLNDPLGYVNGEAGYLLAGIWPCLALAERPDWRSPAAAGSGLAAVVILAGLGVLTQSRSFGLGLCVALALLLGLIPGRLTRAGACLLIAGALALSYSSLAAVWRHPAASGAPTTASTRHAALVLLAAALLAGALWSSIAVAARRWGPAGSVRRNQAIRLANGGLAALALAAVLGVAINAGAIERRIHTQYDAFVHLAPSPTSSRLFSGGGNRFDYWRVAWIEFRSAPLGGVGAGNYPPDYYVHRRTTEAIQQPHSLELQTLAELGLVG